MRQHKGFSLLELTIALAILVAVLASTIRFTQFFFHRSIAAKEQAVLFTQLKMKAEQIQTLGFWLWDVDINNPRFPGNPFDPAVQWANELADWNIDTATIEVVFLNEQTGSPNANLPPHIPKLGWLQPASDNDPADIAPNMLSDASAVDSAAIQAFDVATGAQEDLIKFSNNINKLNQAADRSADAAEDTIPRIHDAGATALLSRASLVSALGYAPADLISEINASIASVDIYIAAVHTPSENAVSASVAARSSADDAQAAKDLNDLSGVKIAAQLAIDFTFETSTHASASAVEFFRIASETVRIGDLLSASTGGHSKYLLDNNIEVLLPLDVVSFSGPEFHVTESARDLVLITLSISSKSGFGATQNIMLSAVPTPKKIKGLTYIIKQALQQYHHETGVYPSSATFDGLESLVPTYLAEIPNDPYTQLKPQITHKEEITDWSFRHDTITKTLYLFPYSHPNFSDINFLLTWTY